MNLMDLTKALLGEPHAKGDLFELKVSKLFPESEYEILHYTPKRNALGKRRIVSIEYPDFQIKHKESGHIIWVECKWRFGYDRNNRIDWSYPEQFNRYREFQRNKVPEMVYVVIGIGGFPSFPSSLYCIPLKDIQSDKLDPDSIKNYQRNVNEKFHYNMGRLN